MHEKYSWEAIRCTITPAWFYKTSGIAHGQTSKFLSTWTKHTSRLSTINTSLHAPGTNGNHDRKWRTDHSEAVLHLHRQLLVQVVPEHCPDHVEEPGGPQYDDALESGIVGEPQRLVYTVLLIHIIKHCFHVKITVVIISYMKCLNGLCM